MLSNSYGKYIIPSVILLIIIMSIITTIALNYPPKNTLLNEQSSINTQTPSSKLEKILGLGLPPIPQDGYIKVKVWFGKIVDPEPEPGNYFIILKNKDFPTVIWPSYPLHGELYKELGNCFLDIFIGFVIDNESFRGFWKSGAGCLKSYINYVKNHEKELNITIIWISQELVPGSKDYKELYGWGGAWTINSKFVGKLIKIMELAGLSEIVWLKVGIFTGGFEVGGEPVNPRIEDEQFYPFAKVNARQAVNIILERLPRDVVKRATAHDEVVGTMLVRPKLDALNRVLEVVKDLRIAIGIMSGVQVKLR